MAASINDLKGDIHAFSDPDSTSGYLVTTALLAEEQIRPNEFFSRTFFTYGHRNVVRAVASGLAQSGSVDGYVWEVMAQREPKLTSRTKILRRSEWLGFPPVATSLQLADSPGVVAIGKALTGMAQSKLGNRVLDILRLDGFAGPNATEFESIARKVERVRNLG